MRKILGCVIAVVCLGYLLSSAYAEDLSVKVKKAIEKSTLDQPGTKPFHLKATCAPSHDRDKDSNRNGEIEIWWESPTQWRREVRSPDFHQIEIMDGGRQWQKNDGDYFPEWLRELSEAIVRPVPLPMDVLLQRVKTGEVTTLRIPKKVNGQISFIEQTNFNWDPSNGPGDAQSNSKGYLALLDGQLSYAGGLGFHGWYRDFEDFHGRMIGYTVSAGSIEVTAKVRTLEDLGAAPDGFFDTNAPGGDVPIKTVFLDEAELRKNLASSQPFSWPPLQDGPLEGGVGTTVSVDRSGKIREMDPPVAENPGVRDAAEVGFRSMQFKPFVANGVPVQVVAQLSARFKTVRPAGVETLDSARNYFNHGRKVNYLAASATAPYSLRAEFQVGTHEGVQTGRYEDTWVSQTEWKREAWVGSSHFARSRDGEKLYLLSDGPDAEVLRVVLMVLEPIPASDTMTESDWRIRRDTVDGVNTIRVFRGWEGPNGAFDPVQSQGYWFEEDGKLTRCYLKGLDIWPVNVEPYEGVQVARRIDVLKDGKLAMRVSVSNIGPVDPAAAKNFKLKGHEWQRAFTAEER
jgi:hypothetical protein